ncbi:4793_t:CDS:2 [Funneliformis geosporum]|uniref:4793_t:CDS:1 n=1 Tax=Funneliformis geosporum TaxID=1117311 RepID=A0A9W4SZ19_9GLOM|nr:4793_t:CDS:2 [Funneliformis geosporum]
MPNIDWKNKIKRKGLGQAPQEASENINNPELAPKDNRFTGRTKQLGLKVKPEFLKRLKQTALEEDCFIVECLKLVSETETDNCDKCDKSFCVECLTYHGEKDSEGELAFCGKCERE